MAKDRIKLPLKTIVQTLPAWWDDLLNAELLETLQSAFADIAGRASAAGLSEVAELALTLQRLVAKINDEMLPMTLQMMYGVVEQGVLKLGVLLLEGERPRAIGEFGTVKLVGAFADLKQLAHEVGEFTGDGAGEDPYPPMPFPPGGDGAAGYAVPVQADGLERLEDLLIEANLLHSQLLPRVNLMKRQQRHIQAELAALRRGGQGASDNAAGTLSGMLNANGALAKLILECEECLRRYRRATHELQQAILAEGTPEFAYPSLPQTLGAAADSGL